MAIFRRLVPFAALLVVALPACSAKLVARSKPDFSGVWQQDNGRSQPPRSGEVTLQIVHHDPELSVETTIVRTGRARQHAVQRYTTDGKESTSAGADGDTFVTRIVWSGNDLVFSIVEHEDGRTLESSETWSITDHGETLKRERSSSKTEGQQIVFYAHRQHQ
jgi:hypothetical protein